MDNIQPGTKLTEQTAKQIIKERIELKTELKELAKKFGISKSLVGNLLGGKIWRTLDRTGLIVRNGRPKGHKIVRKCPTNKFAHVFEDERTKDHGFLTCQCTFCRKHGDCLRTCDRGIECPGCELRRLTLANVVISKLNECKNKQKGTDQ